MSFDLSLNTHDCPHCGHNKDWVTFAAYLESVHTTYKEQSSWHMGQCYFNVLSDMRPDLAEAVRATVKDPFYKNGTIPEFLAYIAEMW